MPSRVAKMSIRMRTMQVAPSNYAQKLAMCQELSLKYERALLLKTIRKDYGAQGAKLRAHLKARGDYKASASALATWKDIAKEYQARRSLMGHMMRHLA